MSNKDLLNRPAPPVRQVTATSPGASSNFVQEQIQKQQKGNFHSSSLSSSIVTMVADNVNKTALHPSGVQ